MPEFISNNPCLILEHILQLLDVETDDEQEGFNDDIVSNTTTESEVLYPPIDPPLEIQSKEENNGSDNVGWLIAGTDIVPFHKFDMDAVYSYCNFSGKSGGKRDLKIRVRQHLASLGWKIEFFRDVNRSKFRMRYTSPQGKVFMSLVLLCKTLLGGSKSEKGQPQENREDDDEEIHYEPEFNQEALVEYVSIGSHHKKDDHAWYRKTNVKDLQFKVRKHLSFLGWKFWYTTKKGKRELHYCSPSGKIDVSLITICKQCISEGIGLSKSKEVVIQHEEVARSTKFRKTLGEKVSGHSISERVIQGYPDTSYSPKPRTVFSWLIDNNVVLPNAKVYYRKDQRGLAEGMITPEGIECACCGQVFTLSKFEAHVGSTIHRSYANIFLEDGRSLLECQSQLRNHNRLKSSMKKYNERMRENRNRNDSICSVCLKGEELVSCDKCPSSYHTTCLGLKVVPDGGWICPSCLCGYCGRINFSEDAKEVENYNFLYCGQCQHKYHMECLKERARLTPGNVPIEVVFAARDVKSDVILQRILSYKNGLNHKKASNGICLGLRSRLGKCIPVGENLTWTLWKGIYTSDNELTDKEVESCNKQLTIALDVMHECFKPLKNPETERDIIEDVIFCRHSELNRLNFEEFFTVILEKTDELVSVANIRIHGEKIAEMPLVATRFEYRKSGMCRILINEIEKMLRELGIQKIVLPAISSVVNIWKNSFGFSEMTNLEKLLFLNHTFLNFEGTIMCQKSLRQPQLFPSSENKIKAFNIASESNYIYLEANETSLDEDSRITECKSLFNNDIPHHEVYPKDDYVVPSAELGEYETQFDAFVKFYKRR